MTQTTTYTVGEAAVRRGFSVDTHAARVRQRIRELSEQLDAVGHKVAYYRGALAESINGKDY